MAQKHRYVISYDITDDKKRYRAADTLRNYGRRVQKSVFECRVTKGRLDALLCKLEGIIDPKTDSVLAYPVCEACWKQKRSAGIRTDHDMDEDFCIR